jgi:hypothetical protein
LQTLYEVRFSVTNAVDGARRTNYVPPVITETAFVDTRIRSKPLAATYIASRWPEVSESIVQYAFKRAIDNQRNLRSALANRSEGGLSRLLFFVSVTSTAIAVVVSKLRKKQQEQQTNASL